MGIRFNFPHQVGDELEYVRDALRLGRLAGDGPYTERCSSLLESYLSADKVLLTHSCTAALEMAAILADVGPGDEVIMPSYTFVSTANAFALRGATPVFVDIRPDTMNIDERLIEPAITPRTRAIVPVHYAGVPCEMDTIMSVAARHGLMVIEDAAQALGSRYKGQLLGTIGDLGAFSFHETKNIVSGEGGALSVNDPALVERAEIIREKGTNRSRFFRGEIDKYTWVDLGSSYLPSELVAAFLFGQLQHIDRINQRRMTIWERYHRELESAEKTGRIRRPQIPADAVHNAHMYYLLATDHDEQRRIIGELNAAGINAVFHYIPLHSTDAGQSLGRVGSEMTVTDDLAGRLLRLPIYPDLTAEEVTTVVERARAAAHNQDRALTS